jgi:hypothetical protein
MANMSIHSRNRGSYRPRRGRRGGLRRARWFAAALRPRRLLQRRQEVAPSPPSPPTREELVLHTIARLEEIQGEIEQMRAELRGSQGDRADRWRAVIEEATTRLTRTRLRLERLRDAGLLTRGPVLH